MASMTRGQLAPLSAREETSLRRVAHAIGGQHLPETRVHRLRQLKLIEWQSGSWRLTPLGEQRYDSLAKPATRTSASLSDEVDRILEKPNPDPAAQRRRSST
jgi:hypothetical protein